MAKSPKTPVKAPTKGDIKKDDKTLKSEPKKTVESVSESRFFKVKAQIEFYDLVAQKQRKIGEEWQDSDAQRVGNLQGLGFITVL